MLLTFSSDVVVVFPRVLRKKEGNLPVNWPYKKGQPKTLTDSLPPTVMTAPLELSCEHVFTGIFVIPSYNCYVIHVVVYLNHMNWEVFEMKISFSYPS